MIGLLVLIAIVAWFMTSIQVSQRMPRWLGITRHTSVFSVLMFPLVLVAPATDEFVGRWQFNRLCERESLVVLNPDWKQVKRARKSQVPSQELNGYVFPIRVQLVELVDLDTNKPFLSLKAFHTKGGFLMRHGLGLDGTMSCWPQDWVQVMNQIDSDKLIEQGKSK